MGSQTQNLEQSTADSIYFSNGKHLPVCKLEINLVKQ